MIELLAAACERNAGVARRMYADWLFEQGHDLAARAWLMVEHLEPMDMTDWHTLGTTRYGRSKANNGWILLVVNHAGICGYESDGRTHQRNPEAARLPFEVFRWLPETNDVQVATRHDSYREALCAAVGAWMDRLAEEAKCLTSTGSKTR